MVRSTGFLDRLETEWGEDGIVRQAAMVLRSRKENVYKLALPEGCGRGYGGGDVTTLNGFAKACNEPATGRIRPAGGGGR